MNRHLRSLCKTYSYSNARRTLIDSMRSICRRALSPALRRRASPRTCCRFRIIIGRTPVDVRTRTFRASSRPSLTKRYNEDLATPRISPAPAKLHHPVGRPCTGWLIEFTRRRTPSGAQKSPGEPPVRFTSTCCTAARFSLLLAERICTPSAAATSREETQPAGATVSTLAAFLLKPTSALTLFPLIPFPLSHPATRESPPP